MSDWRTARLSTPPQEMRPDRIEVISPIGAGCQVQIHRGVHFECLVGAHNQARKLTTGIVTLEPGAELPYHTHVFAEAITLLAGEAVVEWRGGDIPLDQFDNVTMLRGVAHCVFNPSKDKASVFYIMMATDHPTRTLVTETFSRCDMPSENKSIPANISTRERVARYESALRYEVDPNTSFIDYFNHDLMPGIEMCGGYGQLGQSSRSQAHLHDCDESICVIQGIASGVVEGRNYSLSDHATVLLPRGRVHYFNNETPEPMAMLWVCDSPTPDALSSMKNLPQERNLCGFN